MFQLFERDIDYFGQNRLAYANATRLLKYNVLMCHMPCHGHLGVGCYTVVGAGVKHNAYNGISTLLHLFLCCYCAVVMLLLSVLGNIIVNNCFTSPLLLLILRNVQVQTDDRL